MQAWVADLRTWAPLFLEDSLKWMWTKLLPIFTFVQCRLPSLALKDNVWISPKIQMVWPYFAWKRQDLWGWRYKVFPLPRKVLYWASSIIFYLFLCPSLHYLRCSEWLLVRATIRTILFSPASCTLFLKLSATAREWVPNVPPSAFCSEEFWKRDTTGKQIGRT